MHTHIFQYLKPENGNKCLAGILHSFHRVAARASSSAARVATCAWVVLGFGYEDLFSLVPRVRFNIDDDLRVFAPTAAIVLRSGDE